MNLYHIVGHNNIIYGSKSKFQGENMGEKYLLVGIFNLREQQACKHKKTQKDKYPHRHAHKRIDRQTQTIYY